MPSPANSASTGGFAPLSRHGMDGHGWGRWPMISDMIRTATINDVAEIRAMIRELAECERFVDQVRATEAQLHYRTGREGRALLGPGRRRERNDCGRA